MLRVEEFGIYMNYVRKLGFEEAPDYAFLRELFSKALKNAGEVDDGLYDWNLLNGTEVVPFGYCPLITSLILDKLGWEHSPAVTQTPAQPQAQVNQSRGREQRRMSQQPPLNAGGPVVPPSPALVRHGSKRRVPGVLQPGGSPASPNNLGIPEARNGASTPNSLAAQIDVSVGNGQPSKYTNAQPPPQPSANPGIYGQEDAVGYGGPGVMPVTARGEMAGNAPPDDEPPKLTLWRILTCQCG